MEHMLYVRSRDPRAHGPTEGSHIRRSFPGRSEKNAPEAKSLRGVFAALPAKRATTEARKPPVRPEAARSRTDVPRTSTWTSRSGSRPGYRLLQPPHRSAC